MSTEQQARALYDAGHKDTIIAAELGITRHQARTLMHAFTLEDAPGVHQTAPTLAPGVSRTIILSDIHIPFEQTELVQKILAWVSTQHATRVILNGDTMDCASISKFSDALSYPLQDEIERTRVFLDQIQDAARERNPSVELHWHDDNHEVRLERYLAKNADKLAGVMDTNGDPVVSIPHLLDLRGRGWRYRTYHQTLRLPGDLWVEHGDRVSKHSGYTAKNLVADKGGSIIIGHVHRLGIHYKRDRLGLHRGIESGCLCRLDPQYMTADSANWQQGFMIVDHRADSWWHQPVLVQDGRFVVDGELW